MTAPVRILLADDHALVRRGVRLILDAEPDLTVVAEADDGAEADRQARAGPAWTWPSSTSPCPGRPACRPPANSPGCGRTCGS